MVTVFGTNFVEPSVVCVFGDEQVRCERRSGTTLHCIAPANALGKVRVSVKSRDGNGLVYGSAGPSFTYMEPWSVDRLVPSTGWTRGQTIVTIVGRGFGQSGELFGFFCSLF